MTSVTERVPLDHGGRRAVLVMIASLLLALGWLAFRLCDAARSGAVWCRAGVIEGWQSAKAGQRAP